MARSNAVSPSMAPAAASAKKIAGKLAPKITATTFASISRKRTRSTRWRVPISRPEELAVELSKPDGDASSDERSGHHSGIWFLVLQRNGQRESDDRPVDKARELSRPRSSKTGLGIGPFCGDPSLRVVTEVLYGLDAAERERVAALRAQGRFYWLDVSLSETTP